MASATQSKAAETKVACLMAGGFEDSEFQVPYERLTQEGIKVEVIGTEQGVQIEGKKGQQTVLVDKVIDQVKPSDYAVLFIPGGHSPDQLRADERFVTFVKEFDKLGRPIAAICHGPQLLMTAGLVKGRTLTAWKTVQQDLKYAGAQVKDEALVKDGNWITSRQPSDLPAFSDALLKSVR